jgi:hypothetical protein
MEIIKKVEKIFGKKYELGHVLDKLSTKRERNRGINAPFLA